MERKKKIKIANNNLGYSDSNFFAPRCAKELNFFKLSLKSEERISPRTCLYLRRGRGEVHCDAQFERGFLLRTVTLSPRVFRTIVRKSSNSFRGMSQSNTIFMNSTTRFLRNSQQI